MRIGPLTIGLDGPLHIRVERLSARPDPFRLLYVSDVHLRAGRSAALCRQVVDSAAACESDALLLGGDLVDEARELPQLRELVGELRRVVRVFAIGGNHDRRIGLRAVQDAVVSGGGEWIHDTAAVFGHGSRRIGICGPEAPSVPEADVRVLGAHSPRIWSRARHGEYDLVLAGHLHGCQAVAFKYRDYLYPGAMFYRHCCLKRRYRSSHLVVSRGISDLIPIRWGCPREVVLCHL